MQKKISTPVVPDAKPETAPRMREKNASAKIANVAKNRKINNNLLILYKEIN